MIALLATMSIVSINIMVTALGINRGVRKGDFMEGWAVNKILAISKFGKETEERIKNLELVDGTTPNGQEARYVEFNLNKNEYKDFIKKASSCIYATVEDDNNDKVNSVIKVWYKKNKKELLVVVPQEYDSSEEMWEFYDLIYNDLYKEVLKNESGKRKKDYDYKKNNCRFHIIFDGIKFGSKDTFKFTFGGEVDFNFSKDGKNSKVDYLKKTVENDPLFSDNKEKCEEEKLKEEILGLINKANQHHHSVENVSMMASTGKMQSTKQCIGDDRFDVFVYAIDEYCKGNTAWLLTHCTPENKAALCKFLEKICSKDGKLCSDEYYRKIYKITDKTLIDDLKRSGKRSIDSAKRVLEYISLAYRVWIHRAEYYEKEYTAKYKELKGFSSEKLIEESKAVVGVMQKL